MAILAPLCTLACRQAGTHCSYIGIHKASRQVHFEAMGSGPILHPNVSAPHSTKCAPDCIRNAEHKPSM